MIDDMKPGPELDRYLDTLLHPDHTYVRLPRGWVYYTGIQWIEAPAYSTTWSDMRLVVEEMQRRGWDYRIESFGSVKEVAFFKRVEGWYEEMQGEDLCLICTLAAIKALQGSEPDGTT